MTWAVPRDWVGERCLVLCGGESLQAVRHLVPKWTGRVIAVKQSVLLRPDADVLFLGGEKTEEIAEPLLPIFTGAHLITRGKPCPGLPTAKRINRTTTHERWSDDPTKVAGYDTGTSAINLAMLFGATEIVLLGYDMLGGHWFNSEHPRYSRETPEHIFQGHLSILPALAADAAAKGVRIVNGSPISRATCFAYAEFASCL